MCNEAKTFNEFRARIHPCWLSSFYDLVLLDLQSTTSIQFFSYANAKIISGEEDVVVFYNCQLYFSSARRKSVSSGYLLPCFFVPRWPKGLQIIREIVRLQWKLQKRRANGHGSHSITINQDLLINKVHFLFSMIQGIIKRTLSLSFWLTKPSAFGSGMWWRETLSCAHKINIEWEY